MYQQHNLTIMDVDVCDINYTTLSCDPQFTHIFRNQLMFMAYVIIFTMMCGIAFNVFEYVCKILGSKNTGPSSTGDRSMTTQWLIISTLINIYLGGSSLLKHGYYVNHVTCDVLDNADISQLILPLSVFVSYLLYDLLHNSIGNIMKLHHFICILPVIWFIMISHSAGALFTEIIMIAEISTVCLNLKLFSGLFTPVFVISFYLLRPLYMPQVFLKVLEC